MDQGKFIISFEGLSSANANASAEELREYLLDRCPDAAIERQRSDPNAQDFGSVLAIIVGTPAAFAIAKGIADWLRKRPTARLTIKKELDGTTEVIAEGVTSEDAAKIASALQ